MKLLDEAKKALKTVPGKVAAALLTALVGAGVAYFAPGILDSLTGRDEPRVSVQTDIAQIDTFNDLAQMVIVPFGVEAAGNPGAGCTGFQAWAGRVGGVTAANTRFRVVVQGGSEEVYIGGIRARLVERGEPLTGTGFECPSGGAAEVRNVDIDLDQPGPAPSGDWVVGEKAKNVSFTIGPGETEVFDVTAHTEEHDATWVLELVTTQGGEESVIAVDDGGRPFETTAWSIEETQKVAPTYYAWNWEDAWMEVSDLYPFPEYPVSAGPPPPLATIGEPPS